MIFLIKNGRRLCRIGSQPVVLCRNIQSGYGPANHNLLFLWELYTKATETKEVVMSNCVIKTIDRQRACLSFAWVAWIILMGWLLFSGCAPSTSSPTAPQAEEPAAPSPPPPPAPDLLNITLIGMDNLTYRDADMHKNKKGTPN